jgi:nucleotide-binding universal stress UspA family protein
MKRILVPLDGSALAEQAISHATLQARRFGARVFLLRVAEGVPPTVASGATSELLRGGDDVEAYLAGVADKLSAAGVEEVDYDTRVGAPAEMILEFARDEGIDLIVMSTHGRSGIGRWVYGSVADKVLRGADTPVFLIRASQSASASRASSYRRFLVTLDGSQLSEYALPYAEAWAKAFDAEIVLLRVPTLPAYVSLGPDSSMLVPSLLSDAYEEADAYLANVVRQLKAKGLSVHKAAVEPGAVADTIIDYAQEAEVDCIVMSTHGRSGLGRWVYGSVADRVLRGAGVPVLLVRAPRAQSSTVGDES